MARTLLPLLALTLSAAPVAAFRAQVVALPPPLSQAPREPEPEQVPRTLAGERVDPAAFGPGVVETMEVVLERERALGDAPRSHSKARNGAQGTWFVPSDRHSSFPASGRRYASNRWGDTRMGVGFGEPVDLRGAWVAGQGGSGAWTSGLRAIGYRGGAEVARTEWFEDVDDTPSWFAMELAQVDRVVLEARPAHRGGGWYALDDLTFARAGGEVVLDFEELDGGAKLTGSGYGGLVWETGSGDFSQEGEVVAVHPPLAPPGAAEPEPVPEELLALGGGGTLPSLGVDFVGPRLGDTGAGFIPPDTCGSVGPDHFVAIVNANLSVYSKASGQRLVNVSLQSFWNAGVGDPRAVYDPHSGRFVLMASDFSARLYLAVSTTGDPTGTWFKTSVNVAQGSDAGAWPDYPTLGVDAHGVYMAAFMVGNNFRMSVFALDKAPLVASTQALGAVTAWRQLPWEGAIQPCVTHGSPAGEYLVSRRSASTLRIRRIDPPLSAPTMTELGWVFVPTTAAPPDAPALGSTTPLDTLDGRLMNAVYRDGSVWTVHAVAAAQKSVVRWYELDPLALSAPQVGTVSDASLFFSMPSIAVNARGDAVLGMTGSDATQYASTYFTGRLASDPSGQTAVPALMKAGQGPYNQIDGNGTNRWGDYSLTSVDPVDDLAFWTIQEYARTGNAWGTWIGQLEYDCLSASYCTAAPNSVGPGAAISSVGSSSIAANDLQLLVFGLPTGQPAVFFYGPGALQHPFGNGFLCVTGGVHRFAPVITDVFGQANWFVNYAQPPDPGGQITAGSTWNFQLWYRDPAGGGTATNLSDALRVFFCP